MWSKCIKSLIDSIEFFGAEVFTSKLAYSSFALSQGKPKTLTQQVQIKIAEKMP